MNSAVKKRKAVESAQNNFSVRSVVARFDFGNAVEAEGGLDAWEIGLQHRCEVDRGKGDLAAVFGDLEVGAESVNAVFVGVVLVVGGFALDVEEDHDGAGESRRQPQHVDQRVGAVSEKVPQGNFDVVA